MTSKPHMQAGSIGTSTTTRTSKPSDDNLLNELITYLDLSWLTGTATNCCSPDTVSPNDNLSTSELPQTQDSNSETVNKLVSTKHGTVSDVPATQKMADYSHNSSSLCSSSLVTVQLTQDCCQTKAEALWDGKRTYGIKETDSGSTAGSVQVLISDCNIKMSCNAEINAEENKSNTTHKISNNNKENNVVKSTDNVNKHKELLDLAKGSAQQTATDVLEKPWERAEMFNDEDRINSIWAVDSGCSSGDVQALNTSEDKIPVSWNADINSEENKSNSKQKVSNTTKGNYVGNSKEMVNSTEKLSDAEIGSSQHSGRDVLGTPYKTSLLCFRNSRENNFIAPEVMSPKYGLQRPDFPVTILGSETICLPANMPSTPSASNTSTESLNEAETPTTCTSRVTSKCSSTTKSTGVHHTVAQISAAKNSSEEQEETKSTARKINYANTGKKKSEKQSRAEIYSGIPTNIPTKFLQCVSKFSQTVSTVVPKRYSIGQTSATLPLTPEQIYNNIMEKHYPSAVRKHLFSSNKNACVQLHTQKCTPTILLQPNQNPGKSNAKKCKKESPIRQVKTPTKMNIAVYPKFRVIPRNSYAGTKIPSAKAVHSIGNKSATTKKFNDTHTIKMPQPSSVNIVSTHGIVRKPIISILQSLPTILTAPKRDSTANITMTTSERNLCVPVKISSTPTFSTASKGLLKTSATSNVTNPSKTSSSVAQDHMTKSQLPTAPQSNSINLPACYSCVNTADTGHDTLQRGTKLIKQLEYQPIPNNTVNSTQKKIIYLKKGTPRTSNSCWSTLCAKHPKLQFSETSSQTVQEANQQQDTDNREIHTLTSIDDDAAKYAGRNTVRICGRDTGRKPAGTYKVEANFGNRQSAKNRYEMHRFLHSDMHLLDAASHEDGKSQRGGGSKLRDSMLCRSKVKNSSITEQSEGTKRKYTRSKITKNDQKDDGKIKKKRVYARKTRHVVHNNNTKSTPPPPPCSTGTDASCSTECQKRVTREVQRIPHQKIPEKCDNHFSCKNNQKSARMSGKQMQTSKTSTENFTSASPCEPVIKHMKHSYKPSDSNSPTIMDDISSDNMSTQYNTVITSSNFLNNERQTGSQFQYSAPLITEHEHNFSVSGNIHHNTYTAYQQEQMSQIQHNEKYFTNSQNLAELYTGMYEEADTWGDIIKFMSNQEFPMKEVERQAGQQLKEYEHNDQELTWQFQYNTQYFPSSQNSEELLHTDMHKNVGTWGDTFKFNRNHEFNQENVGRHIQQLNGYETSIFQNGNQNVMNETEPNSYGYQLECNRTKLNDEDFQWYEAHNHMDPCNSINNYCKINLPTQTENFASCQPLSKTGYGHQSQYDQAFSAERNSEEVQQPTFTSNEDNVLPTTEMFQEEAWQELDFYTSHKHTGMEQTYFNNEENTAQNWEAQTSNDPLTTYNNRMLIPINSNSLAMIDAEFLKPQLKPTNNFIQSKDAQLSVDYTKIMLEASKKKYAGNKRRIQRQAKPYICSLCGERAQYKVLLQRHLDLHHGHTSENLFSHNK